MTDTAGRIDSFERVRTRQHFRQIAISRHHCLALAQQIRSEAPGTVRDKHSSRRTSALGPEAECMAAPSLLRSVAPTNRTVPVSAFRSGSRPCSTPPRIVGSAAPTAVHLSTTALHPGQVTTRAFMQVVAAGNCARSLYPSVPILAPDGDRTRGRAEATARTGALLRPSVSTARGGRRPRRCGASCTSASEKLNLRSACGSANEALRRPPDELHAYRVSACTISALPGHSLRRLEMLCVDPRLSVDQFRRIAPSHACGSATIAPCGGASATMNTLMRTNSIRSPTPRGSMALSIALGAPARKFDMDRIDIIAAVQAPVSRCNSSQSHDVALSPRGTP